MLNRLSKYKKLNILITFFVAILIILVLVAIFFGPYFRLFLTTQKLNSPQSINFDIRIEGDDKYGVKGDLKTDPSRNISTGEIFAGTQSIKLGIEINHIDKQVFLKSKLKFPFNDWYLYEIQKGQSFNFKDRMNLSFRESKDNKDYFDFSVRSQKDDKVQFDSFKGEIVINEKLNLEKIHINIQGASFENSGKYNVIGDINIAQTSSFDVERPGDYKPIDELKKLITTVDKLDNLFDSPF